MENSQPAANTDEIVTRVSAVVVDMTGDWDIDFEGEINRDTRLIGDLAFESIDIVQLVVAVEGEFQKRGIPFENLLMVDGRYVEDLTVGDMADFLSANM
jgi:acyl carrier protein